MFEFRIYLYFIVRETFRSMSRNVASVFVSRFPLPSRLWISSEETRVRLGNQRFSLGHFQPMDSRSRIAVFVWPNVHVSSRASLYENFPLTAPGSKTDPRQATRSLEMGQWGRNSHASLQDSYETIVSRYFFSAKRAEFIRRNLLRCSRARREAQR